MFLEDKKYRNQLAEHRGKSGEEIAYDFLSQVFGKKNTYKSIKIFTKKGQDDTDIDVLCVIGNKAICVQVKSKKLTQLARSGVETELKKDFKGAVQDAYNQGLICREKILEKITLF